MNSYDSQTLRVAVAKRANRAPHEGRISISEYSSTPRLYYPQYSTMYTHDEADKKIARSTVIRDIYLWETPRHERSRKPKESATLQSHFESKYKILIKDRDDHEWTRKYYVAPDVDPRAVDPDSDEAKELRKKRLLESILSSPSSSRSSDSTSYSSRTTSEPAVTSKASSYYKRYNDEEESRRERKSHRRNKENSDDESEIPRKKNRSTESRKTDYTSGSASSARRLARYLDSSPATTSTYKSERRAMRTSNSTSEIEKPQEISSQTHDNVEVAPVSSEQQHSDSEN